MKKQFAILSFLAFGLFAAFNANGQNYNSAIGARLGSPLALSYKKFISEGNAIELYGAFRSYSRYSWFSVNGAYQVHRDFPNVDNLQWYFGAGAGIFFWNFDNDLFIGGDEPSSTTLAIQGYLGLEYTFDEIPLSLSVDWVPTYFLNSYSDGFGSGYGALAARYVLGN
ncbi:MAG: hypothetical protein MUC59_01545 [Saprospiraceae bacterium]|jgi:hypothetical protein|nr:hypothetical protein [Saprospiraceae bacterium]